ncbi:hypothetical protein GCM10010082_19750 [Kushneria pakistanensis]|uniref:DUF4212 domain-containing protein n=1 Tax=Kushneria pakistanensis TaxID=1508770 RepID=A0ABQ3FJ87_9GAMM|nr:hypothetical protein [Kushneria pakistanensis]GHC26594.1 hypothetical protein GCM10010082_19750 [Kushneria pakistanensis]
MADNDIGPAAQKLRTRFITPRSRRARWLLLAFMLLLAAGCWPVIMLFNRPVVAGGLPLMALWSYVIVFASVALMALANQLLAKDRDNTGPRHDQASEESREP